MAILKQPDLYINTLPVGYEGQIKVKPGMPKRNFYPQVNGEMIVTSDISTNYSIITIPIRVTTESRKYFRSLANQGNNIVISVGDLNFSGCALEDDPDVPLLEIGEYVFKGNPAI